MSLTRPVSLISSCQPIARAMSMAESVITSYSIHYTKLYEEEAEEVLRQTERIALITQNMLAFARKQGLHRGTVRLNELLEEILAQAGHLAPLDAVRIERRLDPQLPRNNFV